MFSVGNLCACLRRRAKQASKQASTAHVYRVNVAQQVISQPEVVERKLDSRDKVPCYRWECCCTEQAAVPAHVKIGGRMYGGSAGSTRFWDTIQSGQIACAEWTVFQSRREAVPLSSPRLRSWGFPMEPGVGYLISVVDHSIHSITPSRICSLCFWQVLVLASDGVWDHISSQEVQTSHVQ